MIAALGIASTAMQPSGAVTRTTKKTTTTVKKAAATAAPSTAAPTTAAPTTLGATTTTPASAKQAADAKPLVIAVSTEPSTLDGQLVNDRSSRVFTSSIFETLLGRDRDAQPYPLLAESYDPIGNNAWRFNLRKGITFHDGTPFNADAVVFSFTRILDRSFGTQRTSYLEAITRAVKVDEFTVDIITSVPSATLPVQVTAIPIVPPGNAARTLGTNPIGTGPYVFSKWDRGREIIAKRNDKYWGTKKPQIAEYRVRIIPDNQTALAALQTGEVDLVLDLLPEQKKLVPKFASVQASEFSYIAFNTYKKELSDARVRRAMNFAVDKELLAKTVYEGEAVPNQAQHLSKEMLGFNPDVKAFPYDLDMAKKLMAEAGYSNGFTIDMNVPIGRYSKGEETAEFVAAQLAKINIRVNVVRMDFNKFRDVGRIKGTAPGAMDLKYAWNSNEFFDGSRIIAHITCDGSSSKICNPQIDKLMDEATKTMNQYDRGLKYRIVWKLLSDDPYSIYLLQQNLLYGMTKRLVWEPRIDDEYFVTDMITTS